MMKLAQHQWSCKSLQVNNHHRQCVTSPTYGGALLQHPKSWGSSRWPCCPCSDARDPPVPKFSYTNIAFFACNTLFPSSHMHMCYKAFTPFGYGVLLAKKQPSGPKLEGVWARGESQKIWDTLLISTTVKASNYKFGTQFSHNLGLGLVTKNNV